MSYQYSSTITVSLTSVPQDTPASVVLNRMSNGRRERFYLDNADLVSQHRALVKRQVMLTRGKTRQIKNPNPDATKDDSTTTTVTAPLPIEEWPTSDFSLWFDLDAEFTTFIETQWKPAWVKWAVKSVEGIIIDDQIAGIDLILESGPVALIDEIHDLVQTHCTLKAELEKN